MSITLFIRKGAKKQRVKLSARAYYKLDNGEVIDFTAVTSCYVNQAEFMAAMGDAKVMAKFLQSEDGQRYKDYSAEVTAKCDSYVKGGGQDVDHLKAILANEVAELPKYFDEWWAYCLTKWQEGEDNQFKCSKGKHVGRKIGETSLAMYRAYYNSLMKFVSDTKRIHITYEEIDQTLVDELDAYLRSKNQGGSSRKQFFAVFNLVAKKAVNRGLLSKRWEKPAISSGRSENVKPVHLTPERINEMYAHKFSNKRLQEAADVFLVGAMCGQRHSDYEKVTDKSLIKINGIDCLDFTQQKTSKHLYVPCDPRIKAILAKYGGALPKINLLSFNSRIKLCGAEMGWVEPVNVDKEEHGMRYVTQLPFFTQLSSHSARRSCLTNMYQAGQSLANIMRVSGHTSEIMLRRYLCLDDVDDVKELLKCGFFNSDASNVVAL